jgi:hypothetical protein
LRMPRLLEITDEKLTAIHEAGHCVGHLAMGSRFKLVTITPDSDSAGHLEHDLGPLLPPFRHSIALVSGTIAVDIFLDSRWVKRSGAFYTDWTLARFVLPIRDGKSKLPADEQEKLNAIIDEVGINCVVMAVNKIYREMNPAGFAAAEKQIAAVARAAEKLIRRRWQDVLKIAEALLLKKTLTYLQVTEILRS